VSGVYRYETNEPRLLLPGPIPRLFADAGTIAIPKLNSDLTPAVTDSGRPVYISSPSLIGFTWAWVLVDEECNQEHEESGFVLAPIEVQGRRYPAQSDVAEFFALSKAFHWLARNRPGWSGEVLSDNHLALSRMFRATATNSIPPRWVELAAKYRRRLGSLAEVPINGHPTVEHLLRGYGHSNFPVSSWNVQTDLRCNEQKLPALEEWYATRKEAASPDIQEAARITLEDARAAAERRRAYEELRAVKPRPSPSDGGG
jgi:hypothetical protein